MMRARSRWLGSVALVGLVAATVACGPEPPAEAPVEVAARPAPTSTILPGSRAGFAASYQALWDSDADLAKHFDLVAATGAKWVRIDFAWSAVQFGGPDSYDWSMIDRAVSAANARGLHVLANPAYTPSWARAGGDDKYPPVDMSTYANFVSRAVQRYAPQGVKHWEIWNEPNVPQFWHPRPDPNAYASMLRAAYAAIKAADPTATVITGGSATAGPSLDSMGSDGVSYSPYRWLRLLYEGGNRQYFDAVATHPYASFPYSPLETWGSAMWTADLHRLMVANGDGAKKLWGTEAGYPTGTASGAVNESTQAQYIEDYLTMWSRWSDWTGPLFIYQMRDRGTNLADRESNFGLVRNNWNQKKSYGTFDRDVG